jgi:hypothetical protein
MALVVLGLMSEYSAMTAGFNEGFRQGFESAALKPMGDLGASPASRGAPGPDPGHYPYARPVRLGWCRDAGGHWAYDMVDEHWWEVICAQCGDTDGPATGLSPEAQALRGPYKGKHRAKRVADKHFHAFTGRP